MTFCGKGFLLLLIQHFVIWNGTTQINGPITLFVVKLRLKLSLNISKVTLSRTTISLNTAMPEWKQFRISIKVNYRDKPTTNKIDAKGV